MAVGVPASGRHYRACNARTGALGRPFCVCLQPYTTYPRMAWIY